MLFEPAAFLEPISLQRIPKRTRHDVALMCGEVLDKQVHLDPGGGLPAESERQANQQVGDAVAEVAADQGIGFDRARAGFDSSELTSRLRIGKRTFQDLDDVAVPRANEPVECMFDIFQRAEFTGPACAG